MKIYGVEFDAQPERDRVVVLAEQPVDYLVYEPDPETLILSIAGATIAPEAAVRIAPEKVGAVSLVTAFAQPDVKRPEVRVVVKRAAGLKPEVTRQDAVLMMDFPNDGKVAAVPPAYADERGAARERRGSVGRSRGAPARRSRRCPRSPASGAPPASIEILYEGGLMDGKEYVGRRISLDFKEVDIADVLRLIAEVSDLNVIAGDEVKGKVTIRLVDVPWDQALDVILLTKGLGFARVGNVLRIAAKDVLAQEEELRLQERRAKEKLEDLVVKLQPVNYAKVAEVSGMVKELLTERGTVNVDKRTNTLIIKDIPSVIDEATALIKAVDTMTPQVMIEAKIVEAGLQYSRELGTRWTFGTNPLTEASLGGRDYLFTRRARRRHRRRARQPGGVRQPDHGGADRPARSGRHGARREVQLRGRAPGRRGERRGQGDLEPARGDARQQPGDHRAGRVDPVPDLRERRRRARVRRRRAEAGRDAAHHRGRQHHHEDQGEPERAGRRASRRSTARPASRRTR